MLTRREFLGTSAAGLGALAFGRGCRPGRGPTARPNFLFILTDGDQAKIKEPRNARNRPSKVA